MKKIFDWDYAMSLTKNPEKKQWLKEVQNTPLTEDMFIKEWSKFPRFGRKPYNKYAPSNCRKTYRKLKEQFGFFELKHE